MTKFLPYGRQIIDEDDIAAVGAVLRSDWLTTGPSVEAFEKAVGQFTGATEAVAVSNGTAALHLSMLALGIGPGDEVIVPAMTFAATANAVLYCGGVPVFADVDGETLLIDPLSVERVITDRTKAIIAVDYAGQPCDWEALRNIAARNKLKLVADACHALGAQYKGEMVGVLADVTVFSFHPVKHITTGEGGMCVTNDSGLAHAIRILRGHGITTTASQREKSGGWFYEMTALGYNYRITDIQCALGVSQLTKLGGWISSRNQLAQQYNSLLQGSGIEVLTARSECLHAYHLYVVKVASRDTVFAKMRAAGIGVNVHYVPVYLHPYYQELGYPAGLCPVSEDAYGQILSLPLWPGMVEEDVERVVRVLLQCV